jgi:hypothetical protein
MISCGKRYPLQLNLFIRVGYPATENPESLDQRDKAFVQSSALL